MQISIECAIFKKSSFRSEALSTVLVRLLTRNLQTFRRSHLCCAFSFGKRVRKLTTRFQVSACKVTNIILHIYNNHHLFNKYYSIVKLFCGMRNIS